MKPEVDAKELANRLTLKLTIKGVKQWRVRLWIAVKLIQLAGKIAWINVVTKQNEETN